MKLPDKALRYWRTRVAIQYMPNNCSSVLDIGCDEGYLLNQVPNTVARKIGVDPQLPQDKINSGVRFIKSYFPHNNIAINDAKPYDVIFALAVFEHFSTEDLVESSKIIPTLLTPKGRLVVTVPQPIVDRILNALKYLRLIDGQAIDEHHGFNPKDIINCFGCTLRLIHHKKFQLGMNNVFVFERSK